MEGAADRYGDIDGYKVWLCGFCQTRHTYLIKERVDTGPDLPSVTHKLHDHP